MIESFSGNEIFDIKQGFGRIEMSLLIRICSRIIKLFLSVLADF